MSILLSNYESSLIGRTDDIAFTYFSGMPPGGETEQKVLEVFHFAFEQILGWEEADVITRLNMYYIRKMKLYKLLQYIEYPIDIRKNNTKFILSLMYPDKVRIPLHERTEVIFERVIDTGCQFPKEYFSGIEGFYRYCSCFKLFFTHYYPLDNIEQMYSVCFSSLGKEILSDYRLLVPAKQFQINILDVIHACTEDAANAEYYYHYYHFLQQYAKTNDIPGFLDLDAFIKINLTDIVE